MEELLITIATGMLIMVSLGIPWILCCWFMFKRVDKKWSGS